MRRQIINPVWVSRFLHGFWKCCWNFFVVNGKSRYSLEKVATFLWMYSYIVLTYKSTLLTGLKILVILLKQIQPAVQEQRVNDSVRHMFFGLELSYFDIIMFELSVFWHLLFHKFWESAACVKPILKIARWQDWIVLFEFDISIVMLIVRNIDKT